MVRAIDSDRQNVSIPEIKMTRVEQLQSACNGSPEDNRLMQLILAVWETERGSFARKRAIDRLLLYAQHSPQMLKSSSRYYQEALNQTWIWLTKHIDDFDPTIISKKGDRPDYSLNDCFFRWVRTTLKWRLRDLIVQGETSEELSLDCNVENDEGNDFTPELASTEPDSIVEILNQRLANDFTVKLEGYLENDPEGRLADCFMPSHRQCNCHVLVLRLVLAVPPQTKTEVAQVLGVNYHTMNSHWTRRCQKLIREICQEIADSLGYNWE
jgi:hypothetical protein